MADWRGGDLDARQAGAGEGRIIRPEDHLRVELTSFRARVERAMDLVRRALELGPVGVSYSGGKDSTVLLDLVRRVDPNAPAAFFDSGCELRQTYDIVAHYGVQIIQPKMTLLEMCRYGGYWGYENPVDPNAEFNFGKVLIEEPARRFIQENGLAVVALGLRSQESRGRWLNAMTRGSLYYARYMGVHHLCPLARWATDDVWAYIAARGLRYNRAYDHMAALGIPRDEQRISTVLGTTAAAWGGRYVLLRHLDVELWNRLQAEFPRLGLYT